MFSGVQVLSNQYNRIAAVIAQEHLDTDWLLHEDYLSEANRDFTADTSQDMDVVREKLKEKLEESRDSGISPGEFIRLRDLTVKHINAFGDSLGGCILSGLTPMDVTLKQAVEPCISKARNLGTAAEKYLSEKLKTLEDIGVITPVKDSTWSSAVFVVAKPGKPGEFRMVIDLRPLNAES